MVLEPANAPPPDAGAERARIAAGRPRHGHEIAEAFTPFEVNLAHEVHLSKGCYTGQEALQRLITYDSVRRRLVRVDGTGDAPDVPREITGPAGVLTSAIAVEHGWIGLAVLKHDALAPGTTLRVDGGPAIDRVEPFDLTRPEGREGAAR
jgi:folate-binding protein YgfZ